MSDVALVVEFLALPSPRLSFPRTPAEGPREGPVSATAWPFVRTRLTNYDGMFFSPQRIFFIATWICYFRTFSISNSHTRWVNLIEVI